MLPTLLTKDHSGTGLQSSELEQGALALVGTLNSNSVDKNDVVCAAGQVYNIF